MRIFPLRTHSVGENVVRSGLIVRLQRTFGEWLWNRADATIERCFDRAAQK